MADDEVWVKAKDRIWDAKVKVGDEVDVREHGLGVAAAVGHTGSEPLVSVDYIDGSSYKCRTGRVTPLQERVHCRECGSVHKFGELPDGALEQTLVPCGPGGLQG